MVVKLQALLGKYGSRKKSVFLCQRWGHKLGCNDRNFEGGCELWKLGIRGPF